MNASDEQHIQVRTASAKDAPPVAVLGTQLGYPVSSEEMRGRLARLDEDPDHTVLVAEAGGEIVGWIHVYARKTLAREGDAEVGGLIVDETCRGRGIGKRLTSAATAWAKERGCHTIVVRSNVAREDTERFYTDLGFTVVKKQNVFRLRLDPT